MRKYRVFKFIAAAMVVVMASVPAMAATADARVPEPGGAFMTRSITDGDGVQTDSDSLILDEDDTDSVVDDIIVDEDEDKVGDDEAALLPASRTATAARGQGNVIVLASPSSAQMAYTIDGEERESISFYMERDISTNKAELPDPVVLRIEQAAGAEDIGDINVEVGVPTNPSEGLNTDKITRVKINPLDGIYLEAGQFLDFEISFVDQDVADGRESVNNDGEKHFITISARGMDKPKRIPVYYGADGFYSAYSVESIGQYEGTLFTDSGSGSQYRLVGHVKLNDDDAPTITIRHKFGVYADMTAGVDAQGNLIPLRITGMKLNPDGNFTFPDGTYKRTPKMDDNGRISISLKFKENVFKRIKREAERDKRMVLNYNLLTDLVIEYNDGYLAGGRNNVLPLVYAVSYIPASSNRPSGGGGGGGGGGSSSGSGISGSVVGPGMTPRVTGTSASAADIGWVQREGLWYYLNAANTSVTGWLLGLDGRWYYLDTVGVMKTGWVQFDSKWYFLNGDGAMAVGWVQGADGKWYYLQQDGSMAVNTKTPDGYSVNQDGVWQSN